MVDKSVVYRLQADVTQFRAQVAAAGKSVGDAADKMTSATKEGGRFRAGLDQLGGTAGKVGLVAAAGLGAAVLSSAKFEAAMSGVEAATRESASGMEDLRSAALKAGKDTVFSATEAAAGIEELSKAGVSTADILSGALTGALDLAAAGELDVGEAAEFTATALNQFSLKGDQASHVADLLAAGAGKAQGEVRDMALALDYAGVPAAQLGVSIEETAGTIALLSKNGIIGEKAGTGLRGMLASLTSPSKIAAKEMEALGLSVFDAQGKFIGFEGVAGQLQGRMGELTDQERANSLGRIFGTEQLQAANILYREGADGVRAMTAAVDDEGFAAENASIKMDNLTGDFERLKGSLETALIGTGAGSQGPLRDITQGITGVVDAYLGLPQAAQSGAAAVLGVTAALGGGLFVASKAVQGFANTRTALTDLGISSETTARGLKGLKTAGVALAGLEVGILAIGALQKATAESLPGLEALSGQLLDLAAGRASGIAEEFDSIGASIGRLADPNLAEKVADNYIDVFTLGQLDGRRKTNAKAEIEALDAALAKLASSASPEVAAAALTELADVQGLSAVEMERLGTLLPQYDEAVAGVATSSKLAAAASGDAAAGFDAAGGSAGQSALEIEAMEKALDDAGKKATESASGFFTVGDAALDAKVSLGDWIKGMEKQTRALKEFQRNAETAADKGVRKGLIASLNEMGPAGARRMRQLANASEGEIERANKAFKGGQSEIAKFADAIVDAVRKALENPIVIQVKTADAMSSVNALEHRLDLIQDEEVVIRAVRKGSGFGPDAGADGMTVRGQRAPYGDKELIFAAPGEEVISNRYGQADRHRATLKAINNNAFANGGTVGNADERLAVLQAEQRIRDIQKELNKDGKDKLSKNAREIAKAELEAAKVALKAAQASVGGTARDKATEAADARDAAATKQAEESQARADKQAETAQNAAKEAQDAADAAAEDRRQRDLAVIEGQENAVKQWISAAEEQKSAATAVRDSIQQNMDRLGEAATSGFRTGLFESQSGNLWAGGGSGWKNALSKDIAGLTERSGIISQLSAAGLSGTALDALLSQGSNKDLQGLINSGATGEFAARFTQREGLLGSVGKQAGMAAYGQEFQASVVALNSIDMGIASMNELLAGISAQRPITVYEAISAAETAREMARLQGLAVV